MIDSDVHIEVPNAQALFPYLADYWIEHITNTLFKGPTDTYYPPKSPVAARASSRPDDGSPAGSSLALVQEHVLAAAGGAVDYAVLNCLYAIDSLRNPDAAVAAARRRHVDVLIVALERAVGFRMAVHAAWIHDHFRGFGEKRARARRRILDARELRWRAQLAGILRRRALAAETQQQRHATRADEP